MTDVTVGDRDIDLLVVGEINPDIIVRDDDPRPVFGQVERWVHAIELVIGSSSVIMACGAARLGLRVAMTGVVGDDPLGRFTLGAMADRGLDLSGVRVDAAIPTGASVILSAGQDRAILTAPGAIPRLRVADIPDELVARARHVHVGSVFLLDDARAHLPDLLRQARSHGATTSVDPNWDPRDDWDGGLREILAETDIFLPNLAEARRIATAMGWVDAKVREGTDGADADGPDAGDADHVATALRALGPRVVAVKLGAAGALVAAADERIVRMPALPVIPIDTTGAGDSFDAGFIAATLLGRSLEAALAIGVACGGLSTGAVGGTTGQPDLATAESAARAAGLLP